MYLILAAAATATLVMTIGQSSLSLKIRDTLTLPSVLEELLSCPYCLSHWVAALLTIPLAEGFFHWILLWLATVAVSQVFILPINMVLNATHSG